MTVLGDLSTEQRKMKAKYEEGEGGVLLKTDILSCDLDSINFSTDNFAKPIISCERTSAAIKRAARLIESDSLVAFPTETVYGLGADATSSAAVSKIFNTKGRPSDNPLIVHISDAELLKDFLPPDWKFPKIYRLLTEKFWPGPLTILVPTVSSAQRSSKISELVTCGLKTVGVRVPDHPIARAIIYETRLPIAAPSANLSGRPSPTTANHVLKDLEGRIKLILDGGPCKVGLESTVVDGLGSDGILRILRPGGLSEEQIRSSIEENLELRESCRVISSFNCLVDKPQTPGMKYKHYSPSANVVILEPVKEIFQDLNGEGDQIPRVDELVTRFLGKVDQAGDKCLKVGLMLMEDGDLSKAFKQRLVLFDRRIVFYSCDLGVGSRPEVSAQRLFSSIRYLDEELGVDLIFSERIVEDGLGVAVMERLHKASNKAPFQKVLLP
ncbi:SUA5 protein [Phakopsora pachyrhizi]|nr:SUA5 protein [Phakopsora pachyrhizi]